MNASEDNDVQRLISDSKSLADEERRLEIRKRDYAVRCVDALISGKFELSLHHELVDRLVLELTTEGSYISHAAEDRLWEVTRALISFYTNGDLKSDETYSGFVLKSPREAYSLVIRPDCELLLTPLG